MCFRVSGYAIEGWTVFGAFRYIKFLSLHAFCILKGHRGYIDFRLRFWFTNLFLKILEKRVVSSASKKTYSHIGEYNIIYCLYYFCFMNK